ncbi:lantibiotic dehydratase [Streptomyces sp. NPDC001920]
MPDASTAAPVTVGASTDPLDVAVQIARRLAPVDDVVDAVRSDSLLRERWHDHGTASGFAGLALLFGCLDRCREGEGWDRWAHEHLSVAVEAAQGVQYLPPGISSGMAGLGFMALCLSGENQRDGKGRRHGRLRRTIDGRLAEYIAAWIDRPETGGDSRRALDVITGAAGISAYLVHRPEADALASLRGPLLTWLATHLIEGRLPLRPRSDAADCGLAHGLPGLVSVLAPARLRGITVAESGAALRAGTAWLLDRQVTDRWGANWPLPRLERGRIVLTPARWRLDRQTMRPTEPEYFRSAFAEFRQLWQVPGLIYLAEGDHRVTVDLDSADDMEELRRSLRRSSHVSLPERYPDPERAWLPGPDGNHAAEIVIPVALARGKSPRMEGNDDRASSRYSPVGRRTRLAEPGSRWVFAKIYAPTVNQDDLLAGPIHDLVQQVSATGKSTE